MKIHKTEEIEENLLYRIKEDLDGQPYMIEMFDYLERYTDLSLKTPDYTRIDEFIGNNPGTVMIYSAMFFMDEETAVAFKMWW